jgi:hypothetical protein
MKSKLPALYFYSLLFSMPVSLKTFCPIASLALILTWTGTRALLADDAPTIVGPNLLAGDFENGNPSFNPWSGVDDAGNLHVWPGSQLAVNETGQVQPLAFSPSVAVGDLNNDGLPDLVVADARGFFWYYANTGKAGVPAFDHGEVMPIWLGGDRHDGDVVSRVQLVDLSGTKKNDIVSGNYAGQLYIIPNRGSFEEPMFRMSQDRGLMTIPTFSGNRLWCNYMAPFFCDWTGTNRMDLLMGEGSYSANSIYLYKNTGSNERPTLKEENRVKIIPGMGREHLTPQVIDWNHDGIPDVISGERLGFIDLYINQAKDKADPPQFDYLHPQHVMFGTTEKIGAFTTVTSADLNHDGKFDLILSDTNGRVLYSLNIGTLTEPKFGPPIPFKGVYPYPKVNLPQAWAIDRYIPYGSPFELLECMTAVIDPKFVPPPPPFTGKGAMKFSIVKPPTLVMKDQFVPDDMHRTIVYLPGMHLTTDTKYTMSMMIRTEGSITNLHWYMICDEAFANGEGGRFQWDGEDFDGIGATWNRVSQDFNFPTRTDLKKQKLGLSFSLEWLGSGTVYFDDFQFHEAADQ